MDWTTLGGYAAKAALEALRIGVAATVSAILALKIVNRAKSRSDHADKRIDDMVADIRAVTEAAAQLWLENAGSIKQSLDETRISTRIRQIEEIRVLASVSAPELLDEQVVLAAQRFNRTVTGGDFGVHNRSASIETARACFHAGNRYISELRRVRLAALQR